MRALNPLINKLTFDATVIGLRKVYPYYYDFTTYAKGRWFGLRLVDVFTKEFQNYTVESCVSYLCFIT